MNRPPNVGPDGLNGPSGVCFSVGGGFLIVTFLAVNYGHRDIGIIMFFGFVVALVVAVKLLPINRGN